MRAHLAKIRLRVRSRDRERARHGKDERIRIPIPNRRPMAMRSAPCPRCPIASLSQKTEKILSIYIIRIYESRNGKRHSGFRIHPRGGFVGIRDSGLPFPSAQEARTVSTELG